MTNHHAPCSIPGCDHEEPSDRFTLDEDALIARADDAFDDTGDEGARTVGDATWLAIKADLSRQLRADPRGHDLPEDLNETLDVLLRCTALLEAAGEEMPSEEDALRALWTAGLPDYDAERKSFVLTKGDAIAGMHNVFEMFRPLCGAAIAERNLWKDEGLACQMVLVEIRKALGITGEEWNNASWSALVPRVKALVERASKAERELAEERDRSEKQRVLLGTALQGGDATIKTLVARIAELEEAQGVTYVAGDQNALALALAFLDDALNDAGLPRVNRKALPPLGLAGWATAGLAQVTLARLAAARVQPLDVQRRIHVAATELERVLFALFDRAVPVGKEVRHAAT